MIRFHIDQIPDTRVSEPLALETDLDDEIVGPEGETRDLTGRISGTLGRDGTDVLVDVTVDYEAGLTCVRCLEGFVRKGKTSERTLFFHEKNPSPEDLERYGSDGWVDLGPWIRELVLTDLPFYPVCRPDCLGLCPRCGENRNTGGCHCPSEEEFPSD